MEGRGTPETKLREVPVLRKTGAAGNKERDIFRELSYLTSQVQMMSDSLAACKQMSKYRSLRKTSSARGSSRTDTSEASASQVPIQLFLSPELGNVEGQGNDEDHHVIVSYIMADGQTSWKNESAESSEEKMADCEENEGWSLSGLSDAEESSEVQLYLAEEVDAGRMVDVIQRELKGLRELCPSVTSHVTAFSESLSHYKECANCRRKISPSLPRILNRIQNLIKYVSEKRHEKYRWPNDYDHLRLRGSERADEASRAAGRLGGRLGKIEAFPVPEDIPGIQLLLEVKPKKTKKKFLEQIEECVVGRWEASKSLSVVQLRGPECVPVVHVLVPVVRPGVVLDERREAVRVKETARGFPVVCAFHAGYLVSLLVSVPQGRAQEERKRGFQVQREAVDLQETLSDLFGKEEGGREIFGQRKSHRCCADAEGPFPPRQLADLAEAFLEEAEKEKMYEQKVQSLEMGVKGLRALLAETHKNQILLSKVLLEKNIFSQPIIKLTDPNMLEREVEVVGKVEEFHEDGSRQNCVEALQVEVDSLRHTCSLKNRLILIITKGLESNIPREWWEDMVEYVLDESKPIEDLDSQEASEYLEQAAYFTRSGESASKQQVRSLQSKEQTTEEELKVSGIVGADVEANGVERKTNEVTSLDDLDGFPKRSVASVAGSPDDIGSTILRLEDQVSLLNTENERLWHEVHDLKTLLNSSVHDLQQKRVSPLYSDQPSLSLGASSQSSARTINLNIQIVDKDFRHLKDGGFPSRVKLSDDSVGRGKSEGGGRGHMGVVCAGVGAGALTDVEVEVRGDVEEEVREEKEEEDEEEEEEEEEERGTGQGVDSASRSEKNVSCLAKKTSSSAVGELRAEKKKLGPALRERGFESAVVLGTPQPSRREVLHRVKPVMWVPSKYVIPEVSGVRRGGVSGKAVEVGYLPQKPSLMELVESQSPGMIGTMAVERELQTIPENDSSPSSSSPKGISQAIQQLRTRVRSIHKDVMVLKSKNDRIDKLLDRLIDDAVEHNESFDEMERDLKRIKDHLG